MKKLLIVLRIIFIVLVVAVAALIGYAAVTGSALDKETKAYVDAAVPAIVSSWNEQELLRRGSPEFKKATPPSEVERLFRWFRTLGGLQKYEGAQGQAMTSVMSKTGKVVSARYVARAIFEHGEANIDIALIKHADRWQIARLKVDSPALVPQPQPSHGAR